MCIFEETEISYPRSTTMYKDASMEGLSVEITAKGKEKSAC
jgi:hypothetical protein